MPSTNKAVNDRNNKSHRERMANKIRLHNIAIKNGLPGDPWVIEHRRKINERSAKKSELKPKYIHIRTAGSFPKGNIPHNKLITDEQIIISRERQKERLEKYYSDPKVKERIKRYSKAYNENNREKLNKKSLDKIKNNPEKLLLSRLRKRLHKVFKEACIKKTSRTLELLGCDIQFFKDYIESKFIDGMNFENYGQWHLDHILPCASFNFSIPDDVAKCFHYTNIQPLWWLDNLKKGDKILKAA
jgi:hypothetical protein